MNLTLNIIDFFSLFSKFSIYNKLIHEFTHKTNIILYKILQTTLINTVYIRVTHEFHIS